MTTPRANVHHSDLPRPGAIVTMPGLMDLAGYAMPPRRGGCYPRPRRFIVEAYPLHDGADMRWTRGIHRAYVRALDNGEVRLVAGHWCEEVS